MRLPLGPIMAASSDTVVTEEKLSTSSTRRPGLSFCLDFFLISVRSMMKLEMYDLCTHCTLNGICNRSQDCKKNLPLDLIFGVVFSENIFSSDDDDTG